MCLTVLHSHDLTVDCPTAVAIVAAATGGLCSSSAEPAAQ